MCVNFIYFYGLHTIPNKQILGVTSTPPFEKNKLGKTTLPGRFLRRLRYFADAKTGVTEVLKNITRALRLTLLRDTIATVRVYQLG